MCVHNAVGWVFVFWCHMMLPLRANFFMETIAPNLPLGLSHPYVQPGINNELCTWQRSCPSSEQSLPP